jgi:hypothetical protein
VINSFALDVERELPLKMVNGATHGNASCMNNVMIKSCTLKIPHLGHFGAPDAENTQPQNVVAYVTTAKHLFAKNVWLRCELKEEEDFLKRTPMHFSVQSVVNSLRMDSYGEFTNFLIYTHKRRFSVV